VEIKIPIWFFQILNFLILCLILRKFLFKPVTGILDKRREELKNKLDEADKSQKQANETQAELEKEKKSLQQERSEILSKTRQEAEARSKEAEAALRSEVSEERQRIQEQMKREWDRATGELADNVAELVAGLSETLLKEMVQEEWQTRLVDQFQERVNGLSGEEREEFKNALAGNQGRLALRSGFPVPQEKRQTVEKQVREVLEGIAAIEWEEAPELLCGLEMQTGGVALDVTLKGRLQQGAQELVKKARPEAKEAQSA